MWSRLSVRYKLAIVAASTAAWVAGIVLGVGLMKPSVSAPQAQAQGPSRAPSQEPPAAEWCPHRAWLRQAAKLVEVTFVGQGEVTPERVRVSMEYGGVLRYNYGVYVRQGRLPAGLEDPLTEWGGYLASHGRVEQYEQIAADILAGCS